MAGTWSGRNRRWCLGGGDGFAARPHGRMGNRTRDELTKATQFRHASKPGGKCKMESGCVLLFAGRYASFLIAAIHSHSVLSWHYQCVRDAEGRLHLGWPLGRGAPTTTYYMLCTKGPQSQVPHTADAIALLSSVCYGLAARDGTTESGSLQASWRGMQTAPTAALVSGRMGLPRPHVLRGRLRRTKEDTK